MPHPGSKARALIPLLQAHVPADSTEAEHRARMLDLLGQPTQVGDPFGRDHYAPGHFTASAFILPQERDALLLIHHRKLDRWLQPGGHVEPDDDDLLAGARREAAEEVGLHALELAAPGTFDLDVHTIPTRGDEPAHAHFDVRFLFVAATRSFVLSRESKAARWVPLRELQGPSVDASVARAARRLQRQVVRS